MLTEEETKEKAERAQHALNAYEEVQGDADNLRDLLTDLIHWSENKGLDFNHELREAWKSYKMEAGK